MSPMRLPEQIKVQYETYIHIHSIYTVTALYTCMFIRMEPYLRVLHDAGDVRLYAVGDAKVNQLQRGVHDDKVGGLQVTVDDTCTGRRDTPTMTHGMNTLSEGKTWERGNGRGEGGYRACGWCAPHPACSSSRTSSPAGRQTCGSAATCSGPGSRTPSACRCSCP